MISIVVPTYQMRSSITQLLNSLQRQANQDFEIIIVNNNSVNTEDVYRFYESLIAKFSSLTINIIHADKNLGAGGGRNLGVQHSKRDVVAFIDDDCIADVGWTQVISNHFKEQDNQPIIYGKVTSSSPPSPPFIHAFDMQGDVFGSGNCAMLRDFFLKLGGFDTFLNNWAEDFEIGERCKHLNVTPLYKEDMLVDHPPKYTPYSFKQSIILPSFYKKYLYLVSVKNYKYKSNFRAAIVKKAISDLIPLVVLGFYFSYWGVMVGVFTIFSMRARKLSRLTKTLKEESLFEYFSILNFLKYCSFSWIIEILNLFMLILLEFPLTKWILIKDLKR